MLDTYYMLCQRCKKRTALPLSDYCKVCTDRFEKSDKKSYDLMMKKAGAMGANFFGSR